LNTPSVQKAIGAKGDWVKFYSLLFLLLFIAHSLLLFVACLLQVDCAMLPHLLLLGDWIENLDVHIPDLLDAGIDVLVYSGMLDFSK
jgi:hypothetical protein